MGGFNSPPSFSGSSVFFIVFLLLIFIRLFSSLPSLSHSSPPHHDGQTSTTTTTRKLAAADTRSSYSPSRVPITTRSTQPFYVKNSPSSFLKVERNNNNNNYNNRMKRRKRIKKNGNGNSNNSKRKKRDYNLGLSAMLPKGFVPASGSSPCQNDQPNSIAFYCEILDDTSSKP